MKCARCGHEMEVRTGDHHYEESGLKKVVLKNITIYRCPSCKETEVEIPHMEELHLFLAFTILLEPTTLKPEQVRFLRKHLGYTAEEFAAFLGVSRVTVTRWETGEAPLSIDRDRHIRLHYVTNKGIELTKVPAIKKVLSAMIQRLPKQPHNTPEMRIRAEDWAPCIHA